jgi:dipeptidase
MDLLRLALERSSSAPDALSIITGLLETYGQGGNCGYRHTLLYHNSFIIADKKEAWVLETVGKHWAAEKVRGVRSISNGLTIGESFDRSSRGVEDYARSKGYLKKHETFNFREAFSDTLYTHFSRCTIRQSRTTGLLGMNSGSLTPRDMMRMLRDHGEAGQGTPPHRTSMGTVCMHASFGPFRASQSTSALVAHLRSAFPVYWATGTSGTCTGVFKPVYLAGKDLGFLNADAEKTFSPDVTWWRHELLHRQAIMKYSFWNGTCAPERDALEEKFIGAEDKIRRVAGKAGKGAIVKAIKFSENCHVEASRKTGEWIEKLDRIPMEKGIPFLYRMFWKGQDRLARLPRRD